MKKIAFISDYFIEDGVGGAELTTNAIMQFGIERNFEITGIHCAKIDKKILDTNKDTHHFIVCNFFQLHDDVKIHMIKNCSYSIVEYDYKICKHRSFELHQLIEGEPCDCEKQTHGKINSAFYGYAEKVWFMSEKQKNMIREKVKVLKEENCHEVLSSVFSNGDLRFIFSLKDNEKDNKYLILDSVSPVKPSTLAVAYAEENNLEYELISDLQYHELLIKMSTSKGLIFLQASDTCPRLVMEAKMLGCELSFKRTRST